MFKLIIPTILIVVSVLLFVVFANPLYQDIVALRAESASYKEALDNSKALENERDKLTQKYNAIDPASIEKLQKLLPDSVDNIRLILEIEKLAMPYGMALRDVKYDAAVKKTGTVAGGEIQAPPTPEDSREYGSWTLEFSITGTYPNYLNFLKDLEQNLRIVDIVSISFSSDVETPGGAPTDIYKYGFKIKTYWLKN